MKSGYHFGNYQIFSGTLADFTYTALKPVKAYILPKHQFLKVLDKYPDIKKSMTTYAFKMVKQTYKAMVIHIFLFAIFLKFLKGWHFEKLAKKRKRSVDKL